MKRTQLESYVKRSFHMTVEDFVKQKAGRDGLADREIDAILHISTRTVATLLREYGIQKPHPFFRRFERR